MKGIIFRDLLPDDIRNIQKDITAAIHPATISPDQALVQVADLPFYDKFKLYAVTDLRLSSENAYELLCGPGRAFLLNGQIGPIFSANELAPLRLSPQTIIPYIKFFFHYTDTGMGRYSVAETVDDIPWLPDTDEDEMAEAASLLEDLNVPIGGPRE